LKDDPARKPLRIGVLPEFFQGLEESLSPTIRRESDEFAYGYAPQRGFGEALVLVAAGHRARPGPLAFYTSHSVGKPCLSRTPSVRAEEKLKSFTSHSVSRLQSNPEPWRVRLEGACNGLRAWATLGGSSVHLVAHAD
jgi:hypothetical protein